MQPVVGTMTISLDGIGAGPNQTEERPFGDISHLVLHRWMFETPDENRAEMDAIVAAGAYIMGRNMFGPVRGEWDRDWRGWWGADPPYHRPVFVLTHHPRASVEMEGGTTFHFVTDGIESAVAQARTAADGGDVSIAGGVTTLNAALAAGLVDELRLHVVPFTVGEGLRVFDGVPDLSLVPAAARATPDVTHLTWRRPE